jgi:hypothetical protein
MAGVELKRKCFRAKNFSYPIFFSQKKLPQFLKQGEQLDK